MKTGDKIRFYRIQKKITQDEIAQALGITQRTFSKIENNEIQLKIDRLEKIAELLQVEPNDLMPNQNNQVFENVHYSQIGNGKFINQVNEKERELYEKIIQRQQEEIDYLKGIVSVFKG